MHTQSRNPARARSRGRAALGATAAGALVATALAIPVAGAANAADAVLLSQGKDVSASSVENADYTPARAAVDGDTSTRWASEFSDDQSLTVELDEISTLERVELQWEGAYGKAFEIQVSDDGSSWSTAATVTDGTGGTQTVQLDGATGKFVKLVGTERGTGYGYSLWEFQVFGTPGASSGGGETGGDGGTGECSDENSALGGATTASSFENEDYYPSANAVDGNNETRWSSAASDDEWLQVDLGSVQEICGVDILWEGAYGKAYTIEVSEDGSSWDVAGTVVDGDGGQDAVDASGAGRFVRLAGSERGTGYGYSVYELAVHTTDGGNDTGGGDTGGGDTGGGDTGGGDTGGGDNGGGDEYGNPYPDYVNAGYPNVPVVEGRPSKVEVTGTRGNWVLEVDDQPYTVKGLTWGPSFDSADHYMKPLVDMGANTVRTWGTGDDTRKLLDSAAANDIRVAMGFWLVPGGGPGSGGCLEYTTDTQYKADTMAHILQQVENYKNHPGVLLWSVGNESLLGLTNCYSGDKLKAEQEAYATYVNDVAKEIHKIDQNHPVTSTDAWLGAWPFYRDFAPDLDLLQINSYGDVCNIADAWEEGGYDRPYMVTEGGADGEWEVEDDENGIPNEPTDIAKGAAYVNSWECIMEHKGVGLGATFFHYGIEGDFGGVWFNVIPGDNKRLGYYALAKTWGKDIEAMNTPPEIQGMSIAGNTKVEAGQKLTVQLDVSDPEDDPINYVFFVNSKYIDGAGGLQWVESTSLGGGAFEITAPQGLGVWKVYAFAEDGQSNVGVDTESIRVVAPEVAGTNVALGKSADASSFDPYNGDFTPKQAFDGNQSTRWSSAWNDAEWIQVDLGSKTSFDKVQLIWETAFGKSYEIQVSDDGSSWQTVKAVTGGDGGVDTIDAAGSGRYVRLALSERGTEWGYSLFEMGIYAS
ncbi:hypothetical protein GCM10025865_06510 [Paraoerskovia sediminicola]|uniref:F5/8 type C domain-containing protein n=1 Tax=Paraoerskovia sediminicola TaxID=1138587 RepID=A0ABM8FZZ4_9CELL|nr:discoidin domain-containing protein [Paraoerskovia sediminicola]BDZ41352.1 hypothetical protein GCM10025865_06510 [Paraoerskovia sediminicola]